MLGPQPEGSALTLWRDPRQTRAALLRFSAADADAYPRFQAFARQVIEVLDGLTLLTPPKLAGTSLGELWPWLRFVLKARGLGERHLMQLLRVLPMTAAELLDEHFESSALKGVLGAAAVLGGPWGPMAAGTAFALFYQKLGPAGGQRFVRGGLGQVAAALAAAARAHGAHIRTDTAAARILLDDDGANGRAVGVALASGETLRARAVVSSADPRHTLFDLVGPAELEPRTMRQARNIRFCGATAKVNLALRGLPRIRGVEGDDCLAGHIVISPSLEYIERAADAAKYGEPSDQPVLDAVIPTLLDPSLAPAGRHVLAVTAQWAPYHLRGRDWDSQREALGERVVATLAAYAPNLPGLIEARQVITPLDFERTYGLAEGSPYHGEMALDQLLLMRPVPGFGQYRAPIANLYLCGAGTHPGGGVTGAPGYNAAREILADLRGPRA
ncbi:MAG: NAD(P)/FAD-dependent oxidoreductase [Anaerolineales bacterium]|nr:NAD(P)/FAD-dependent oxidoreductase [Anaerolineales bacterium]